MKERHIYQLERGREKRKKKKWTKDLKFKHNIIHNTKNTAHLSISIYIHRQAMRLGIWQDAPIWWYSRERERDADSVRLSPSSAENRSRKCWSPQTSSPPLNNGAPWIAEASRGGQLIKQTCSDRPENSEKARREKGKKKKSWMQRNVCQSKRRNLRSWELFFFFLTFPQLHYYQLQLFIPAPASGHKPTLGIEH